MSKRITAEQFESVLAEMYKGQLATNACKKLKIDYKAFKDYADTSPETENSLARAEIACIEHYAAEIIEISDGEDDPNKARNRIDTRKWIASRLNPKRFGDRIDVTVTKVVDLGAALNEAASRLLPSSYPANNGNDQAIEITARTIESASGSKPVDEKDAQENEQHDMYE